MAQVIMAQVIMAQMEKLMLNFAKPQTQTPIPNPHSNPKP